MKALVLLILFVGTMSFATTIESPYKNQKDNSIKSLTADDLDGLKKGSGTPFSGMAKAAELNGIPGPRHVLDMMGHLKLSKEQETKISKIFEKMRVRAISIGEELIEIESAMDKGFNGKAMTAERLQSLVDQSAKKYGELRFSHLVAHLETAKILSENQIAQYNKLRGYGSGDPCQNIPEGHSEEMWKKHHGCK